jgi:hypothetical protein
MNLTLIDVLWVSLVVSLVTFITMCCCISNLNSRLLSANQLNEIYGKERSEHTAAYEAMVAFRKTAEYLWKTDPNQGENLIALYSLQEKIALRLTYYPNSIKFELSLADFKETLKEITKDD